MRSTEQKENYNILYLVKIAVAYRLDLNEGFKKVMRDIKARYAVS